jgi:hypothetical protein
MEPRFFHGPIRPMDVAQALVAEFNRGSLQAQYIGAGDKVVVQVVTRPDAPSGGKTAVTVTVEGTEGGIQVQIGEQAWLGVAASLGVSALAALRNPLSLLGRLDDIAQDVESLQLSEQIWRVIDRLAAGLGASTELAERLRRVTCDYCWTANPVGQASCLACGAPLGKSQPTTCPNCGFVAKPGETVCANCGQHLAA